MKQVISLLALLALGTAFLLGQAPEKKMRIVIDKDDNGTVTRIDTTFQARDLEAVKTMLQEKGIDLHAEEMPHHEGGKTMELRIEVDEDSDGTSINWIGEDAASAPEGKKIIRIEVDTDEEHEGDFMWIQKDGEGGSEREIINLEDIDGDVETILENLEGVDEATKARIREAMEMHQDGADERKVKVLRFESEDPMKDGEKAPRIMMFKMKEGEMDVEEIDADDVQQIDVRRIEEETEDGMRIVKEVRIVIKLKDVEEADKEALKRAGAPVAPSIAESLQLEDLSFYPNPNDGRFRLSFNAPEAGDVNIRVVNMEGKTLYQEILPDFSGAYQKMISIEGEASGAYLLSIAQNGKVINKKLIKQQ